MDPSPLHVMPPQIFSDALSFASRIALRRGVPEFSMQTSVNANRVTSHSRRVTVESRFVTLALIHDGFALKIYKSSSGEAVEQVLLLS